MEIISFKPEHSPTLLALFDLLSPAFFAKKEAGDLAHYLQHEVEDYFLVMEDETYLASGGINYFPERKEAYISWDLVHPEHHKKGIGSKLLIYRLEKIKEKEFVEKITVRTSQFVFPFYEKHGFELKKIEKDYWAEGFDLYEMSMELVPNFSSRTNVFEYK